MGERIISFYKPNSKTVRDDLFNEFAEKVANTFAKISPNPNNPNKPYRNGVSSTQLRKIFDEVKRYERLLTDGDEASWLKQYPYIKMINSKVHYAVARAIKNAKDKDVVYYKNLQDFISEGINLIKDMQDYFVFVALFESVYGFYYEKRPDLKN